MSDAVEDQDAARADTVAAPPTGAPSDAPTTATQPGHEPTVPTPRDSQVRLELGALIGERYLVVEFIGEGGMGAVYRAVDQKLGEDVALKVVRGALADAALRQEVRLAQKVTHRNVCRTYDLEEVGGHSFVKMEYVRGETLSARLRRARMTIADALWVARGIADGLDAAHAQSIVHRDLKPGNIMLAADRPVLMDFGIARQIDRQIEGVAGTPGYMAPEQIMNLAVDERADYYALGCLLYEMLAGEPVFGTGKPVEIATRHASMPAPSLRAKRPDTPRWLAHAVATLLAKDPARRAAGVARLRGGPRSRAWFAAPLLPIAAAAIAFALVPARGAQCKLVDQRLHHVWDADVRRDIERAFLTTKKPFAPPAFAGVARALDRYAAEWSAAATDNCAATEIRAEQNERVRAVRDECLDACLEQLRALTALLATADASVVERGDQVVFGLAPIAHCSNVAALHEPVVSAPEQRARVEELRHQLAEAQVDLLAGKYLPSLVAAQKCIDSAKQVGYEPYIAEALWIRGSALLATGNPADAAQEYGEAVYAGLRADHGDQAANAAHSAAIVAVSLGHPGEAKIWLGVATAAAKHGNVAAEFERTRIELEGLIATESGDVATGVREQERALQLAEQELGKNNPILYENESTLGTTLSKAGAFADAAPHIARALELREASVGPDHPDVAALSTNLGAAYTHLRELAKARAAFERALAIREKMYGPNSPLLIATLDDFGELLRIAGEIDKALAAQERALAIAKIAPGEDNPMYQQIATDYADTLVAAQRAADARALLDTVLANEQKQQSPMLPTTLAARADVAVAERAWADAATYADRAIAAYEAAGGIDNPVLWRPLATRARVAVETGKPDDAKRLVDRAVAVGEKGRIPAADLKPARALLASLSGVLP